jgi:diguanylate cyclase (GGDEF)-like protein
LEDWIERLIDIRLDARAWVPASRTMNELMLPQAENISGSLQNVDALLQDDAEAQTLRLKAMELRVFWQQVLGQTRLLIANRFGTFSNDPSVAMESRSHNLEDYLTHFRQALAEFTREADATQHDLVVAEAGDIRQNLAAWRNGYQQLGVLINREGWRQDVVLLNLSIKPLTERMTQRLNSSRLYLQANTQAKLLNLLQQGEQLARGIGWLAAVLIGLFGLGYLAYQRWLLKPIEHISEQLQREGRGEDANTAQLPLVTETRRLVQSFGEMREQVRARERHLDHMAYHDSLTGLPNRVLFHARLNEALHTELPRGGDVAVLFMDLDRFKQINDTHGHLVGDKLLIEVAHRLRAVFRSEDLVARLSGDEFAVLLQHFGHEQELSTLAHKAIDTLAEPFNIDDITFRSSGSVGMSIAPRDGNTADRLIQHADTAMYHAKGTGRAKYARFTPDMLERSVAQLELENQLHTAMQRREFRLYAQPIVDCASGRLHGHECLLRWDHPEKGILAPIAFLDALEDIGLIREVTDWILDELEQTRATQHGVYSINLSALQLSDASFLAHLQQRISTGDIRAENLVIEITEDTLSDDLDRITLQLADLQAIGVRIALDDFGTGQSSLSHLRAFPFDTVKIDRSFVRDVITDEQDATLVRAVVGLAHTLDMVVVAEGVETEQQHAFLQAEGCDLVQGYLFGRPAPLLGRTEQVLPFVGEG